MNTITRQVSSARTGNRKALRSLQQFVAASVVVAALFLAPNAGAVPVALDHMLGTVVPSVPTSGDDEAAMINFLVSKYNSGLYTTSPTVLGDNPADPGSETYKLYFNHSVMPSQLPQAVYSSTRNPGTGNSTTINFGSQTYQYLYAKYGSDVEIYYIGDLSGTWTLPNTGRVVNHNGLSHYSLFGGTTSPSPVPEGGATVALLGLGLLGLAFIRRTLR
ncbi:MAG: VPDSG-CTERM sorting domain-containing protein [Verrucomicrobia bacterium]|nr:VPDSG-CTERM sorting domain-containing protein [Verrucomicrobiota bacterium]